MLSWSMINEIRYIVFGHSDCFLECYFRFQKRVRTVYISVGGSWKDSLQGIKICSWIYSRLKCKKCHALQEPLLWLQFYLSSKQHYRHCRGKITYCLKYEVRAHASSVFLNKVMSFAYFKQHIPKASSQ